MNIRKRLKHIVGRRCAQKPKLYGATLFPTKEDFFERRRKIFKRAEFKIFKNRERKNLKKSFLQVCCDYHSVFGLSFDAYICARACAWRTKICVFSTDVDAVKCQNIAFKGIFKPTERISTHHPNSYPPRRF